MIVRAQDRVLVQGITGKQGTFWTEKMHRPTAPMSSAASIPRAPGRRIAACRSSPPRREAMKAAPFDVAVMFIPPPMAKRGAASAAIEAGVKLLVILTEHIPAQDVMVIHAAAQPQRHAHRRPQHRRPGDAGRVLRRHHAGLQRRASSSRAASA